LSYSSLARHQIRLSGHQLCYASLSAHINSKTVGNFRFKDIFGNLLKLVDKLQLFFFKLGKN